MFLLLMGLYFIVTELSWQHSTVTHCAARAENNTLWSLWHEITNSDSKTLPTQHKWSKLCTAYSIVYCRYKHFTDKWIQAKSLYSIRVPNVCESSLWNTMVLPGSCPPSVPGGWWSADLLGVRHNRLLELSTRPSVPLPCSVNELPESGLS